MPTHNEFENYGGIIDALNTVSVFNGNAAYGYSKNFDGIIQAILDLGRLGDAGTGEYPLAGKSLQMTMGTSLVETGSSLLQTVTSGLTPDKVD